MDIVTIHFILQDIHFQAVQLLLIIGAFKQFSLRIKNILLSRMILEKIFYRINVADLPKFEDPAEIVKTTSYILDVSIVVLLVLGSYRYLRPTST